MNTALHCYVNNSGVLFRFGQLASPGNDGQHVVAGSGLQQANGGRIRLAAKVLIKRSLPKRQIRPRRHEQRHA